MLVRASTKIIYVTLKNSTTISKNILTKRADQQFFLQ